MGNPTQNLDDAAAAADADAAIQQADTARAARAAADATAARAKPLPEEIDFALRQRQGGEGPAADYARTISNPNATQAELERARAEFNAIPATPGATDSLIGGGDADTAVAQARAQEANPTEIARGLGFKTKDQLIGAIQSGQVGRGGPPAPAAIAARTIAGGKAASIADATIAKATGLAGGGQPPAATPQGGGYGGRPADSPQSTELQADLDIGDIKTPADYAGELRADIASGKISPEEGRRRSLAYRDWYNSAAGGARRLEASQVAQQRQAEAVALDQQHADIATAQKIADTNAQAAQAAKDLDEQRQAAERAYNETVATQQANLTAAMDRAEHFTIDPSRTFTSSSGIASGILAGIGLAIGAVGQAISRGAAPNPLPAIISRMVDREVDAQHTKAQQLAKGVTDQANLMSVMRVHFADEQQQRAVAKATMYETLARHVAQTGAEATTDKAKRAAALVEDQLRQKAADQQLAYATRTKAEAELAKQQAANAAAAAQAAKQKDAATEALVKLQQHGGTIAVEVAGDPVWSKLAMQYSPTLGKYMLSEQSAKAAEGVADMYSIADSIDELKSILARPGSSLSADDRARAEALASQIKPRMSVASGQGAMSEGDRSNIEKGLPEGGIDLWGTQIERLETTARAVRQKAADTARALPGLPGAPPAMLPNEQGVPTLYAQPSPQGLDSARGFIEVGEGKNKKKIRIGEPVGPTTPDAPLKTTPGAAAPTPTRPSTEGWQRNG